MLYKEDVLLAIKTYIHHQKCIHNKYYNEITFLNHYCKKFGLPKTKYKNKIIKIYLDYMEDNK